MKRVLKQLRDITGWVGRLELFVGGTLLAFLTILIIIQVVQRWTPIPAQVWVGELATYGFVWMSFAVFGLLVRIEGHVGLELIDFVLPEKYLRWLRILVNIVIAISSGVLAYFTWVLLGSLGVQKTPGTGIPLVVVYGLPFVAFVLATIHGLLRSISFIVDPEGLAIEDTETNSLSELKYEE